MNIRAKIYGGVQATEEPLLKPKRPKGAKADTLNSVTVRRETSRATNARSEDRHRLNDERARLTFAGTDYEVELINLSGGGAMIGTGLQLMLWDRVNLHLGNHGDIECAVCWVRDGKIGLEFAHETRLDWPSDQVATVLRHVIERTFPHISFEASEETPPPPVQWTDEHRDARRHPLIWNGVLHHDYQSSDVRIRNISESGAMIELSANIRVGSEPLLEFSETVSMSATVEWAVGDQVGLRFHVPFEMEMLSESRPTVAATNWVPPAYLDPDSKAGEDHWKRLSISQLRQELEGFMKH
jgi:hypothetical protein